MKSNLAFNYQIKCKCSILEKYSYSFDGKWKNFAMANPFYDIEVENNKRELQTSFRHDLYQKDNIYCILISIKYEKDKHGFMCGTGEVELDISKYNIREKKFDTEDTYHTLTNQYF